MGKKAVKVYFRALALGATVVVFVLTLLALTGGDDVPAKSIFQAMLTVTLPVWIVLDMVFTVWWIIRRRWFVAIPVTALACCCNYIGTVYRFGGNGDNGASDLMVVSYNVCRWGKDGSGIVATEVKQQLMREGADIICLQEFNNGLAGGNRTVCDLFKPEYPYSTRHKGDVVILSKFPIVAEDAKQWEYTNSSYQWADIKARNGRTVRIYNMHLQSTSINSNLKKAAQAEAEAETEETGQIHNAGFYDIVAEGYAWGLNVRSGQAIDIANSKRECKHEMIVCGDFNDVPYSFAYNTIKGDLCDGFVTAGNGLAATYKGAKGLIRIDYIMHSESLKGGKYYSRNWDYSDHNPVFMGFVTEE